MSAEHCAVSCWLPDTGSDRLRPVSRRIEEEFPGIPLRRAISARTTALVVVALVIRPEGVLLATWIARFLLGGVMERIHRICRR